MWPLSRYMLAYSPCICKVPRHRWFPVTDTRGGEEERGGGGGEGGDESGSGLRLLLGREARRRMRRRNPDNLELASAIDMQSRGCRLTRRAPVNAHLLTC